MLSEVRVGSSVVRVSFEHRTHALNQIHVRT